MFGWFKKRKQRNDEPLVAEFAYDPPPDTPRHTVTLTIADADCLTPADLQQLRRHGVGVSQWWLKHDVFGFARVPLPRGDRTFARRLTIPAGRYTLGVGREPHARRIRFRVTSDGSLARITPRTEAHAECPR